MVKAKNVMLVTVSLIVPAAAYGVLVNRRLERRIPLVTREKLPDYVTKTLSLPGRPKLNYVEGYCADLPRSKWSRSTTTTHVEDVARVFLTTLPMRLEWNILSFLTWTGLTPFEERVDPSTKANPDFTKGKPIMGGVFVVEKGVEVKNTNEILFSWWMKPSGRQLLGGVHSLVCEPVDERTNRIWFITHLAIDSASDILVADEASRATGTKISGFDPVIVDPKDPQKPLLSNTMKFGLWMHRLYSRVLMDFTVREISMRK